MKINIVAGGLLLLSSSFAFSASGIFGTGSTITNNGDLTLYQTTLLGDSRHAPVGASPIQNSVGLGGLDLGTFDPGAGDSLLMNGGGVLTFKNGTDDITGARVFYSVNGAPEVAIGLGFNENDVNGVGGDQRWYLESSSVDLLAGLTPGSHTLDVRYEADFTFNGGGGVHNTGPFTATFTTIPEPSVAILGGLSFLGFLRRKR